MAQNERTAAVLDLRGLDLVTPVDLLKDGRTPYAKNFRLYAQQSDDRRVAVSSRKGPGFYIDPLGEMLSDDSEAVVNGSTAEVGITTGIHLQPITAASTGPITAVDIYVANPRGASGPLLVEIWTDTDGAPGQMIGQSSVLSGDITNDPTFQTVRFVNAPRVDAGSTYWIVLRIQDDGNGTYDLVTTEGDLPYARVSNSTLATSQEQTYRLPYRIRQTPEGTFKGAYRFTRDNGDNITMAAYEDKMYKIDGGNWTEIATGLNASATEYSFDSSDNKVFWVNGYDQLKAWNGTSVETITDTELPILSQILFHKDLLFGVPVNAPDKLVWSEGPGEPAFDASGLIPTPVNQQWYYAWKSVSFWYVPRPHSGSPITGLVSFQDALTVFTQDNKYIFSGFDLGNFNLRQATGAKGALSRRGVVADANRIYFVGDDGLYEYNGSQDTKISSFINPLFDSCGVKEKITPVIWNNEVRFYFASEGSAVNDSCIIYNKDLKEMMYDTGTYVDRALYYQDADDQGELIEFSSLYPGAFQAEVNEHSLGAPIDFEYRLRYESMGSPAQKKRVRKFYPLLQGTDVGFPITLAMDKDFEDSPRTQDLMLTHSTPLLGQFNIGDGTKLRGGTPFQLKRMGTSGYAHYWQLRIKRKGVNNRVAFIGAQYSYKTKRL